GLQIATVPMSSGLRDGCGREIGPRCRRPEIARKCEAAVRQEGPLGKPGGLFLCLTIFFVSRSGQDSRAAARLINSPRRACAGPIRSFITARISAGAVSGEPALNGGAGLYSSLSWIASAVLR